MTAPIYIADAALYLMTNKPELGIKDPYELNEDQYKAALDLLRQQRKLIQRYWHDAMSRSTTSRTRASSPRAPGRSRSTCCRPTRSPIASTVPGRKAPPAGPTPRCCTPTPPHPELRLYVAGALARAEGAGRRRRLVRLGARGPRRLQGQRAADRRRAARPTASTTSTRSSSGRRRSPSARRRATCVPYYRWVTDYIAVIGGR